MPRLAAHLDIAVVQFGVGAVSGPMDAWLTVRGIKTLAVRLDRHSSNAQAIAEFLEHHPAVERVAYPGLKAHPQYALAQRQMKGPGGMVSVWLKGGFEAAKRFMERTELFACAESLGGVESLANHPAVMTHASVPKELREAGGVTENLIRLSIGVEDVEDLIADLDQALG